MVATWWIHGGHTSLSDTLCNALRHSACDPVIHGNLHHKPTILHVYALDRRCMWLVRMSEGVGDKSARWIDTAEVDAP